MKTHLVYRKDASQETLLGRVICGDLRDRDGKVAIRKGEVLDAGHVVTLTALPWEQLSLIEIEPGDVHEARAGERLAHAVVGRGVKVAGFTGGQWALASNARGLLSVNVDALQRVNSIEAMSVYTLFHGQPVGAGETVAKAKITPLVTREADLAEAERLCKESQGLVSVTPFQRRVIGAVAREHLDDRARERFQKALSEKIGWFGSTLIGIRFAPKDPDAVARDVKDFLATGAEIVILAGASALDPLDPVFQALVMLGAKMARHGAPAHPGSLFWLARLGDTPLIGMPTCGMFSQATTFDLILPRILAGERVDAGVLARLGHGGLLSREMAFRFPPYRAQQPRGELPE
ncbi:MAG TPA: hypothetical protein VJO34_07845 [Methylomirabilota bacterium]|nr:hypothetical protein [Methylomirabilota bacterium]